MKRVTSVDVAKRAGVSRAAVSMAMSGSSQISTEKADEIRRIAKELNYHPHAAGQILRSMKTDRIGCILNGRNAQAALSMDFNAPILACFVEACNENSTQYMVDIHREGEDEILPQQMTSSLVDGSIIVGDVGDKLRSQLEEWNNYPCVSIDEPSRYCVITNAEAGIVDAINRLVALGHRRIAYAGGPQRYLLHRKAMGGFQNAVRSGIVDINHDSWIRIFGHDVLDYGSVQSEESIKWARSILTAQERPTAVICHGILIARAVVFAATELGMKIPEDLSVVSWGSAWIAQQNYPKLATVEQDFKSMVTEAMNMLKSLTLGKEVLEPMKSVDTHFVNGATLGEVKK